MVWPTENMHAITSLPYHLAHLITCGEQIEKGVLDSVLPGEEHNNSFCLLKSIQLVSHSLGINNLLARYI